MDNKEIVKKAVKYIEKYGNNKTTMEEVAKNAGFSIDYFNRMFRNHTGFNVMEYIRFRRLNKAAGMLRKNLAMDILSIALECGWESHEGFTRAFKEQYGRTPSEFRETMKDKPFIWADYELNATAVGEFRRVLPQFYEVNADEVIDWLLDKDTSRFGYTAVSIEINGSKILADSDFRETGCFVAVDNFCEEPYLYLVMKDTTDLREYVEKLMHFSPGNLRCIFHTNVAREAVETVFEGITYKSIREIPETMYFGEPFILPKKSEKYTVRLLEEKDTDAVQQFISRHPDPIHRKSGGFGLLNMLKVPLEHRFLDQPFGIFDDGTLIAYSRDGLQSTHGFQLNNCISTPNLPGVPDEAIRYLYMTAANAAMDKGYILFEDSQFGEYAKTHGNFTAYDLGFEQVNTVFDIGF
ncbi:MAG: helix-turn-helix transcriptional regulator [Ruminococcaceae bacterium]|nr:helix-turn-helix transcriptional regulator [Oscillospiraceae bacterium]